MDDGAATILSLIIFLLLLLVFCIFNGFRAAAEHFNAVDLEEIQDAEMKKKIHAILEEEAAIRRTYLVFSTQFLIVCGILSVVYFRRFLLDAKLFESTSSYVLASIVIYVLLCFVITVAGVFVPVKLGERKAEHWLTRYVGFIRFLILILRPVVFLVNGFSNLFLPIFKADPHEQVDAIDEDEIISMIDESHEQGMILESEAEMIHNIFEFDDKNAADIMTPRTSIVAMEASMNFEEAFDVMLLENFSRFPVYEDDIDHMIGTVHIKDAMGYYRQKEYLLREIKAIPGFVRDMNSVPETQNINDLLRQMQKKKEHMCAVVDEYGQVSGIVTLEDILEEIVGEIEDEHDEDISLIVRQSNGNYLLNGMAALEDVKEALGLELELSDINTLNGFLISLIDKIPEDHETFHVSYGGYDFRILSVSDKVIKTVLAVPVEEETNEEKE